MRHVLLAGAAFIGLFLLGLLLANFLVGSGSSAAVVEAARARCVQGGFPAKKMLCTSSYVDNGAFGFGGTATVEFAADGRFGPDGERAAGPLVLRVALSRRMNLMAWEVVSIEREQ
jgi:hypothetical protein